MVLAAFSDTKLHLLSKIAFGEVDSQFLLSETKLSAKAFYSRISRLLKVGIISIKSGKYSLTSFGKNVLIRQSGEIGNSESLICLKVIPIKTQGTGNTAGGLQAT
jgi:predicted transcriptional regulator